MTSFLRVVNESRRSVLGARVRLADSWLARVRGFLFRARPQSGEGLLLAPCRGVHMYGMRFALDVLLIDEAGTVIAAHNGMQPGDRTPIYRQASYALELPAGAITDTRTAVGDRLSWAPASSVLNGGILQPAVQQWNRAGS